MKKLALLLVVTASFVLFTTMFNGSRVQAQSTSAGLITYAPDGSPLPNGHVVLGTAVVPAGGTIIVRFSGAAAFTSTSTYGCFYSDNPSIVGAIQKIDGAQIRIPRTSDTALTLNFICVGN